MATEPQSAPAPLRLRDQPLYPADRGKVNTFWGKHHLQHLSFPHMQYVAYHQNDTAHEEAGKYDHQKNKQTMMEVGRQMIQIVELADGL